MTWAPYLAIALCSFLIEVGWIAAVRAVKMGSVFQIVSAAVMLHMLSYWQTLILVSDHWTMIAGAIGAGFGAWIGLRLPERWLPEAAKNSRV